jgi:hypothetical protein
MAPRRVPAQFSSFNMTVGVAIMLPVWPAGPRFCFGAQVLLWRPSRLTTVRECSGARSQLLRNGGLFRE